MTTNSPLDGSGRHQGEYIISNFRNTLVDSKPQDKGVCSLFFSILPHWNVAADSQREDAEYQGCNALIRNNTSGPRLYYSTPMSCDKQDFLY